MAVKLLKSAGLNGSFPDEGLLYLKLTTGDVFA